MLLFLTAKDVLDASKQRGLDVPGWAVKLQPATNTLCVCKKLPNNFTINLQFSDYISLRDFLWIQCFLKGNKANGHGYVLFLVHD